MAASSRTPNAAGATPAMAQWFAAKEAHPDALVFFRMGDFYELFFADAEAAAAALDIALTQRGEHDGRPIPMCGVPQHAAEAYLARLIRRGFRVAVAEQMEDPEVAHRQGADPPRAWCVWSPPARSPRKRCWKPAAPICCSGWRRMAATALGAAWLDVSTGLFETAALAPADLPGLLGRLEPAEILAPAGLPLGEWDGKRAPEVAPSPPLVARRRLAETFGVASVDAFGSFTDAEAIAALMAVDYVRATQAGTLPRLARPAPQGQHRAAGDGRGDARQSGDPSGARRRHAAHAARHRAADADAGGCAAAGRMAGRAAHRSGGDRGAAGCLGVDAGRSARPPAGCGLRCGLRRILRGRSGGCRWDAAGPGIWPRCATACARRERQWRPCERGWRQANSSPLPLREGVGGRGPWNSHRPLPRAPSRRGRGRLWRCFAACAAAIGGRRPARRSSP